MLNDYPNHWTTKKLKYLFNYTLSSVDRHVHLEELPVDICHYPDVYHNEKIRPSDPLPKGTCTEDEFLKFSLRDGDILITKDSESPDDIGVPCLIRGNLPNTVCGYHLGIIRPKTRVDSGYFFRFLQTDLVKWYFYGESSGITRYGLGKPSVENLELPVPPLEEQQLISRYLDKKTEQIDSLIEKIQKKIELLKEQRTSLINQCVTKGLDPNVEMKDSGVEWIGEIPSHWKLTKLGYLGSCSNGVSRGSEYFGNGHPFITYGDVYNNDVIPTPSGLCLSDEKDWNTYSVCRGDIFFTRTSETIDDIGISSVCLETIERCCFSGFIIRFRPSGNELNPNFSRFYFRSTFPLIHFTKEMNQVTRSSLSQGLLKTCLVPIPPELEQEEISSFLSRGLEKIDLITDRETERVRLLREYRQSLISSVVTGKVRVTEKMI